MPRGDVSLSCLGLPALERLDKIRPFVNIFLPRVFLQQLHDRLAHCLGPYRVGHTTDFGTQIGDEQGNAAREN